MSDLIKREDAIEAIEELPNAYNGWSDAYDKAYIIGTLEEVPSADRPQEWIPCSERLPKIGEKVLASTKKTVFTQVFKGYYSEPKRWAWENNRVKEIEAWQPLPKPWKGADNEADNN